MASHLQLRPPVNGDAVSHGDEEVMPTVLLSQFRDQVHLTSDGRSDSQSGIAEQRLLAEVVRELNRTGYPALRQIDLHCEASLIALCGEVPSFFLKQLAQVTVMVVPGVERVQNQLRVSGDSARSDVGAEGLS